MFSVSRRRPLIFAAFLLCTLVLVPVFTASAVDESETDGPQCSTERDAVISSVQAAGSGDSLHVAALQELRATTSGALLDLGLFGTALGDWNTGSCTGGSGSLLQALDAAFLSLSGTTLALDEQWATVTALENDEDLNAYYAAVHTLASCVDQSSSASSFESFESSASSEASSVESSASSVSSTTSSVSSSSSAASVESCMQPDPCASERLALADARNAFEREVRNLALILDRLVTLELRRGDMLRRIDVLNALYPPPQNMAPEHLAELRTLATGAFDLSGQIAPIKVELQNQKGVVALYRDAMFLANDALRACEGR